MPKRSACSSLARTFDPRHAATGSCLTVPGASTRILSGSSGFKGEQQWHLVGTDRHGGCSRTQSERSLITRDFDAPIALVFDVVTKPEHVSRWGATPPDQMTECSIDLRVGGNYHYSFVTRRRNHVRLPRHLPGG